LNCRLLPCRSSIYPLPTAAEQARAAEVYCRTITNSRQDTDKPDTPDKPDSILAHKPDTHDKPVQAHKPDKQLPACNNCQAQTTSDGKPPSEQHRNNHDIPPLDNVDKLVSHLLPQVLRWCFLQLPYHLPKLTP
jgi:hypothetical protein